MNFFREYFKRLNFVCRSELETHEYICTKAPYIEEQINLENIKAFFKE